MDLIPLQCDAPLSDYEYQASALFSGWQSGDATAIGVFRSRHPKFLDDKIPWLQRRLTDDEVRATSIDHDDAKLALARWYDFYDWSKIEEHVAAVAADPRVHRFECAVDAIVSGDAATASRLLREDPELVRARSTRVPVWRPP